MALPNIFKEEISNALVERIHNLKSTSKAAWGIMNVGQMLAHINVMYEMTFENNHPKPNSFMRFILKALVKQSVVSEKKYPQNGKTAPNFIIKENKNFEIEKQRLINYIKKAQGLGEMFFDNKESHSFGKLSKTEWSNMFYKHIDHHLKQFGV